MCGDTDGCCEGLACTAGRCTAPACVGNENCACDVTGGNAQCNGLLECAQFGPLVGTCQVSRYFFLSNADAFAYDRDGLARLCHAAHQCLFVSAWLIGSH